ncbi:MAG: SAM-dependent methyltransferase [Gemmatimonadota bacterium]
MSTTMPPQRGDVDDQYGTPDLVERIEASLRAAGLDPSAPSRDDIAGFDEFHIRGREATRELGRLTGLESGMRVLDVGCGLGGPARTLATEFGCRVVGLELTKVYCRAARLLNERLGVGDAVRIHHGDALDPPFDDATFDAAVIVHVTMNVADKRRLFAGIRRLLRRGGRLGLYEILAGPTRPEHVPVPWADDPELSHLIAPDDLRALLERTGYRVLEWNDVGDAGLAWFRARVEAAAGRPPDAPPPLGLNILLGESTPVKVENVIRNLEEDRIRVVMAALEAV